LKRSGGTADRAVAVGMLAMLVSSLAVSAALLADAGREVRVGVYSNPPKIDIEDGSGSGAANRAGASGLFAKLLGEIARLEGWRLLYVPCDWADCLVKLEAGQLDLMPDVAFTPARIERFGFHDIAAVASWSQVFALPQEHLNSPRALNGMRVALLDGGVQQEWMERLRAEDGVAMDLVVFPRIEEAFAAVAGGRADAVITNHFAGQHFAPRYGLMETPVTFDQVPRRCCRSSTDICWPGSVIPSRSTMPRWPAPAPRRPKCACHAGYYRCCRSWCCLPLHSHFWPGG
jgi:ABC-type amino acid transport substrate-binding protein